MYKSGKMMIMVCESPLHAGTGSDLDFIDKPIQRERHTQFPKIEGSSLKGALRERIASVIDDERGKRNDHPDMNSSFGPFDPKSGEERQGSLGFSDGRLLLFPVKSMKGVFAWVTCPRVLRRFVDDMQRLPDGDDFAIAHIPNPDPGQAVIFGGDLVVTTGEQSSIVLEEFDFATVADTTAKVGDQRLNAWLADTIYPTGDNSGNQYWHDQLKNNLVVLRDEDFGDFVEFTTEVITRNKIDPDTGTVAKGHLFTEEYLPSDSVLYTLVMAHPEFKKGNDRKSADDILLFFTDALSQKCGHAFQSGGNATIGKGLMRTVFVNPNI